MSLGNSTPVVGHDAIAGFAIGGNYNYGWSDKDQCYAATVDAGERTRDVIQII